MMRLLILYFFMFLFVFPSQAWNNFGHMEVAAVAWSQLKDSTKKNISQLLKLNPYYAQWVKDVAEKDKDQIAFLLAATWPDKIKLPHSGYQFDGDYPVEPQVSLNIGYADKLQHRYWHFLNFPFSIQMAQLL